jgi:hypothetical protein
MKNCEVLVIYPESLKAGSLVAVITQQPICVSMAMSASGSK